MVFIDYQNVQLIAHRKFAQPGTSPSTAHTDPLTVGRLLVSRRNQESTLVGLRV